MRILIRLLLAVAMLAGLVATAPIRPALADCDAGSTGDDTIVCDTDLPNPETTTVLGDTGQDNITVEEGASVEAISGGTANLAIDGGQDNDTYNIAGNVEAADGTINIAIADTVVPTFAPGGDDTYNISGTGFVVADNGAVNVGILDIDGDDTYNTAGAVIAADGLVNIGIADGFGDDTYNNNGVILAEFGTLNVGVVDLVGDDSYNNSGVIVAVAGDANLGIVDVFGDDILINDGDIVAGNTLSDGPALVNFGVVDVLGNDTVINNGNIITTVGYVNAGIVSIDVDPLVLLGSVTPLTLSDPSLEPSEVCVSDIFDAPCSDDVYVNNGTIESTYGFVNLGIVDGLGNDSYTNNGQITVSLAEVANIGILDIAGNNEVTNNGAIVASDGLVNVGILTAGIDELFGGCGCGDSVFASDVIVNNGDIITENGAFNIGIASGLGDDLVVLGDGSYTAGDAAVVAGLGSDTVVLGSAGVSYGTQCEDISVTHVADHGGAAVSGILEGDGFLGEGKGDTDTLVLSITTASGADVEDLAAQLAALDASGGTITVGDNTYTWSDFENLVVQGNVFTEGQTKLFDDGVVLAFTSKDGNGIDVCHGPSGLRAGTVGFFDLEKGIRDFSANGFNVHLDDLGGGQYHVHIFEGGVEQINDADGNGAADSSFIFGH